LLLAQIAHRNITDAGAHESKGKNVHLITPQQRFAPQVQLRTP
jgi:hypothetical protein